MFQCNYVTTLYSVLNNFRRSLRSRPHLDRVSSVAFFDARFACGQLLYQFNLVLLALFGPSVDAGCATQEWLAAGRPLQVQYVFDVHMYTTPLLLDESPCIGL